MIEKVCFTGHRTIPADKYKQLEQLLNRKVEELALSGCKIFNAGGALGFDTMAAEAVLGIKSRYPHIQLHLYLPYPGQRDKWTAAQKKKYDYIKNHRDKIVFSAADYTLGCMNSRNRRLADNRDCCIAYCTKAVGGTAYTMGYAMDSGIPVINLAHLM